VLNNAMRPSLQIFLTAVGFCLLMLFFYGVSVGWIPLPEYVKRVSLDASEQQVHTPLGSLEVAQKTKTELPAINTGTLANDTSASSKDSSKSELEKSLPDSILQKYITSEPLPVSFSGSNTKKERVLLIGDSQSGGLRGPVYSYCAANGHELVACVSWVSSTLGAWAYADTLDYFLKEFDPSLVIVCIGLNEVFSKDVEKRMKYVRIINEKIEASGARRFWLGPASWIEDQGIIRAIRESNGVQFFDATKLYLSRGDDGRHPDWKSYRFWFAHAAAYMTSISFVDFSQSTPLRDPDRKSKYFYITAKR
jgi:hypothetical protein